MPTLFINDITHINASYACPQRGIVGESWIVDLAVAGPLNEESMIIDFGIIKPLIKDIVDDTIDHTLILPNAKFISKEKEDKLGITIRINLENKDHITLTCPHQSLTWVETESITTEALTSHITSLIQEKLPPEVKASITLRYEEKEPYFHYTHGLKKHDGNCQRMAHGHRSHLTIVENGQRNHALENQWCQTLTLKHIGTREDIIQETDTHFTFGYNAPQGRFELTLAKSACYILECDSTIECIATHLKSKLGKANISVCEGINKGASA